MPRVDLHSHTRFSPDSRMGFRDIADTCSMAGIDVLATTDHHTAEGAIEFRAWTEENDHELDVIVGEEILTDAGEIIGLFLEETIESPSPLEEAIQAIHDQGGLFLLQHPFDPLRKGLDDRAWDVQPDIVEVFNARTRLNRANEKARQMAEERELPMVACSDAHTLGEFGAAYTEVPEFDPTDPQALVEVLDEGHLVGATSPVWVSVHSTLTKAIKKLGF